jgi:hypothetical protein
MADQPVVFTDREEALAAVAGLLDPGSRQQVLVVHGAPGWGSPRCSRTSGATEIAAGGAF